MADIEFFGFDASRFSLPLVLSLEKEVVLHVRQLRHFQQQVCLIGPGNFTVRSQGYCRLYELQTVGGTLLRLFELCRAKLLRLWVVNRGQSLNLEIAGARGGANHNFVALFLAHQTLADRRRS